MLEPLQVASFDANKVLIVLQNSFFTLSRRVSEALTHCKEKKFKHFTVTFFRSSPFLRLYMVSMFVPFPLPFSYLVVMLPAWDCFLSL